MTCISGVLSAMKMKLRQPKHDVIPNILNKKTRIRFLCIEAWFSQIWSHMSNLLMTELMNQVIFPYVGVILYKERRKHVILYTNMQLIFEDTRALVKFLERDSTAIVPVQQIQKKETLEYGGSCAILWCNIKSIRLF